MTPEINPIGLLNNFLWAVVAYAVSYCLLAFGLSLLGARVRQRSTWLAWFPFLNLYLMCRLAQAPLLLILPVFIPLLNLLVFAYLGARMAKRVGRSAALGALFGVPVLGNVIPLILSLGRPTEEEKAAPAPAQPPVVTALIHAGVVFTLLALPVALWQVAKRLTLDRTAAPTVAQATAALPERIAGTMTEFPIDTATSAKASPIDLHTSTFAVPQPGDKPLIAVDQSKLPPWIKAESITAVAESATTANFVSAETKAPVSVVNLALRPQAAGGLKPPSAQELAAMSPGATAKGVEVKTADNQTYRGYRVQTDNSVYYALQRPDSHNVMLISAVDQAGVAVAERLATSLGNGRGLMDDELSRGATARLAAPPPGMRLVRLETATTAQIDAITARMNNKELMEGFYQNPNLADKQAVGLVRAIFELAKQVMPRSYTSAFFKGDDQPGQPYSSSVAGFPSSADAWTAMKAAAAIARLCTPMANTLHVESIEVGGYSGFAVYGDGRLDRRQIEAGVKPDSFALIALRDESYVRGFLCIKEHDLITAQDLLPWVEANVGHK